MIETLKEKKAAEIADLTRKLADAKADLDELNQMPEIKEVATELHELLCHWNHTDGCGWFYDKGDWSEYSRKEYLEKAEAVLAITDTDTVLKVIKASRN